MRRIAFAAAAVALLVFLGSKALRQPALPRFSATGTPLALPSGQRFVSVNEPEFERLLVGQRGKPVVVNIWASWCAPCRTEMPLLQAAANTYKGRAVVLGVASNDDPRAALKFLTDRRLTYPNVFDATGGIRVRLGLTAYPTTYIFGRDGSLRARVNGGISEQRLAGLIDDALR